MSPADIFVLLLALLAVWAALGLLAAMLTGWLLSKQR